jgi:hypothetical protein
MADRHTESDSPPLRQLKSGEWRCQICFTDTVHPISHKYRHFHSANDHLRKEHRLCQIQNSGEFSSITDAEAAEVRRRHAHPRRRVYEPVEGDEIGDPNPPVVPDRVPPISGRPVVPGVVTPNIPPEDTTVACLLTNPVDVRMLERDLCLSLSPISPLQVGEYFSDLGSPSHSEHDYFADAAAIDEAERRRKKGKGKGKKKAPAPDPDASISMHPTPSPRTPSPVTWMPATSVIPGIKESTNLEADWRRRLKTFVPSPNQIRFHPPRGVSTPAPGSLLSNPGAGNSVDWVLGIEERNPPPYLSPILPIPSPLSLSPSTSAEPSRSRSRSPTPPPVFRHRSTPPSATFQPPSPNQPVPQLVAATTSPCPITLSATIPPPVTTSVPPLHSEPLLQRWRAAFVLPSRPPLTPPIFTVPVRRVKVTQNQGVQTIRPALDAATSPPPSVAVASTSAAGSSQADTAALRERLVAQYQQLAAAMQTHKDWLAFLDQPAPSDEDITRRSRNLERHLLLEQRLQEVREHLHLEIFRCIACCITFESRDTWSTHRDLHGPDGAFQCGVCGECMNSAADFNRHFATAHCTCH